MSSLSRTQRFQAVFETLGGVAKNVLTLSSGAVILVSTFLKDVFPNPVGIGWLIASLVFLTLTIVVIPISLTAVWITIPRAVTEGADQEPLASNIIAVGYILFFVALFMYAIGIGSMAIFVIVNILAT